MIRSAVVGLSCLALFATASARAHFVWVDLKQSADGQPQAQLYLSELPEPGEPHLIAKVAQSKAWIRGLEGATELKFAPAADKDLAALVAACPKQSAGSLEAICKPEVSRVGWQLHSHPHSCRLHLPASEG